MDKHRELHFKNMRIAKVIITNIIDILCHIILQYYCL